MPYKDPLDDGRWRKRNPEKVKANHARSYLKHKDTVKLATAAWRTKKPGHAKWCQLRGNAKVRGIPFLITREEFIRWLTVRRQICSYCDLTDLSIDTKLPTNLQLKSFSVDRINSDLPYTIENITLACWFCNRGKGNVFTHDEWREIAQKYVKPKWVRKLEIANAH